MDKKYIIIALLIIAVSIILILVYKSQDLKRIYKAAVLNGLVRTKPIQTSTLTENDIKHLPMPVQKYLTYVGAIGKEKVHSVRIVFDGELKSDPYKDFFKIQSEQYNFFDKPTRLFFIKAKMFGFPVLGLHSYTDIDAYMLIKLFGLVPVLDAQGEEIRISDTTTLFNDLCFFAPSALIDKRIQWETIDSLIVRATFENMGCKISAELYFNDKGELINFSSLDRFYGTSHKKARWETPARDYKSINGIKVPTYAEAIWKLPEGDFCYGRFTNVKEVQYNVKNFKWYKNTK